MTDKKDRIEDLKQLGFHVEFDVESDSWFASRSHDNAKIIVTSESQEGLWYEIVLSYQALLMQAYRNTESLKL